MAEFVTYKEPVLLKGITGNGARMKKIVEAMLLHAGNLSIINTVSDTKDQYTVDLSWNGCTDWIIHLKNGGTDIDAAIMENTSGSYEQLEIGYCIGTLSDESVNLEVNTCGSDFLLFSFIESTDSDILSVSCFRITDQFTKKVKSIACVYHNYATYYPFGDFYIIDSPYKAKCKYQNSANGLVPNGMAVAVPVVFYTDSTDIPFSGFVGDGTILYYVYQGTSQMPFNTRLTKFTIDSHNFVSLGQYLCARTN